MAKIFTQLRLSLLLTATVIMGPLAPFQSDAQTLSAYDVDERTGLRMERYRAPVPADVPDATTLTNDAARTMHQNNSAVFIDVYPPKGLGPDPLDGHWVIMEERFSIPGAIWLPEVGRGSLEPDAFDYFERNLARLSKGDKTAALLFFCTSDCWQSWNATRRASAMGYTNLFWYPLGSDGWQELNGDVQRIYPVNFLTDALDKPEEK